MQVTKDARWPNRRVTTLKERMEEILDATKLTQADIARACGLTDGAVAHWFSGETRSIKGQNAAKIESRTGFRAAWIATGKGPKLISPSEEGDMLLPHEVELIQALRMLTKDEQERHMASIKQAAEHNQRVLDEHLKRNPKPPNSGTSGRQR